MICLRAYKALIAGSHGGSGLRFEESVFMVNSYILSLFGLLLSGLLGADALAQQRPAKTTAKTSKVAFADLHIHTTFKHYYGDLSPEQIEDIYQHRRSIPYLRAHYGRVNWDPKVPKPADRAAGTTSFVGNYNQGDFTNLTYTPGSVLCASLYPYEKQFAVNKLYRDISSKLVSHIPLNRLEQMGQEASTPWENFLTEYAFLQAQETKAPTGGFQIQMARNKQDLLRILQDGSSSVQVLTIEGGQVLYGPLNAANDVVRQAFTTPEQLGEMLAHVDTLRKLPHKVFFITPSHFTDNRIAGFSKTIDRDGLSHLALKTLSNSISFREGFFTKFGEGIHGELDMSDYLTCDCPDLWMYDVSLPYTANSETKGYGEKILTALVAPDSAGSKRILIDVKHFDIQARLEYYALAKKLAARYHLAKPIPIIAGHVALSGESQPVAVATGLNPMFDQYEEIDDPLQFYKEQQDSATGGKWNWLCRTRYLYKHHRPELNLYFPNNASAADSTFNPFSLQPLDSANIGWFYPWSINLCNEEVKTIYDSGGIIGLNLDQRILGGYMLNYKNSSYYPALEAKIRQLNNGRHVYQDGKSHIIDASRYRSSEPFLRNILHVVLHSGREDRTAWDCVAIGSDFDGLIDPIDVCPTASQIPVFYQECIIYLEAFWECHKNDPQYAGKDILFKNSLSYEQAIKKVFFQNARDFVVNNF